VEPLLVVERNADVVFLAICSYHSRLFENVIYPVHLMHTEDNHICLSYDHATTQGLGPIYQLIVTRVWKWKYMDNLWAIFRASSPLMRNILARQFSLSDQKSSRRGVPANQYACCCFTLLEQSPDGATGFIRIYRIFAARCYA